jgi:hypothetical protein
MDITTDNLQVSNKSKDIIYAQSVRDKTQAGQDIRTNRIQKIQNPGEGMCSSLLTA